MMVIGKKTKMIFFAAFLLVALAKPLVRTIKLYGPAGHDTESDISGKVTRVVDGDSLYVEGHKLRLWGVDAPETNEYGYYEATKVLSDAALDNLVDCTLKDKDRHERDVAMCHLETGEDLGAMVIRSGWAHDYTRHTGGYYKKLEDEAHASKRGLWASHS